MQELFLSLEKPVSYCFSAIPSQQVIPFTVGQKNVVVHHLKMLRRDMTDIEMQLSPPVSASAISSAMCGNRSNAVSFAADAAGTSDTDPDI